MTRPLTPLDLRGAAWLRARHGERAEAVRRAYAAAIVPEGANGRVVLADLAAFCHADEPTFVQGDPMLSAYREGARGVWLHLCAVLALDPALLTLHRGAVPPLPETEDL